MSKGFYGIGHCAHCGDTEGPWSLIGNEWLCDACADLEESKTVNILNSDPVQDMVEDENE